LDDQIDTVCLMAAPKYQFVSSRMLNEVAQFCGYVTQLVPPAVAQGLRERLERDK